MTTHSFDTFFRKATYDPRSDKPLHTPYAYQRTLGELEHSPSVLAVPTGSGKTLALLVAWLYGRLVRGTAPRRLVYALPMRSLVEQTARQAQKLRDNLGLTTQELGVHALMGGVERAQLQDWRARPEQDQILVGTIDMLLSRALNRGYAENRFAWPIAFGLLNADCRWIFDEVQLMGVAAQTAAQLDGLRRQLGVAKPCESVWVSATVDQQALLTIDRPQLGDVLELPAEDANGPLKQCLEAEKRLDRVDLTGHKSSATAQAIAAAVADRHLPGTRSIVVVNRVDLAQQTFRALGRTLDPDTGPETVLLHARFRPQERARHMDAALADIDSSGPGRIVVSTQVIEAGIDTSSALLATETAPFSSIVQRLGRCNRDGKIPGGATVLWLDRGELDAKAAAPYEPAELAFTREALFARVGESLSPNALAQIKSRTHRETANTLRRRDLIDLFDTAPDLSGTDVHVSRFIRTDDERSISVFFRDIDDDRQTATQPAALREELVQVPTGALGDRAAWIHDHVNGRWRSAHGRAIRPGTTVMLAAADGGYDEDIGWEPKMRGAVSTRAPKDGQQEESVGSDDGSYINERVTLSEHLDDAHACASDLLDAIGAIDGYAGAERSVLVAAALHDVGKAHPAFQEMLREAMAAGDEDQAALEGTLWAKSDRRGGRNKRRHFRHELASALALIALDPAARPDGIDELAIYLIAAHHGRVRMSIRPAPEERPPADARNARVRFALGVAEGDELQEVQTPLGTFPAAALDLACMEMGGGSRSWAQLACDLRDDPTLGPFRLAYLEALVRLADWRASRQPHIAAAHKRRVEAQRVGPAVSQSATSTAGPSHEPLRVDGCTPDTLIGYLKSLGLLRVVTQQVDSDTRGRWHSGAFELACALNRESLAAFLLERYVPAPVVSPWNGGSGFFPKDNKKAIETIETTTDARLTPLQRALVDARAVLSGLGLVEKPDKHDKLRLLRELRAWLADDAVEWLDAAAILVGDRVEYPPLLGSGGNDGRFDFANNYAQAVVTALALPASAKSQSQARALLDATLHDTAVQLRKMSAGHFQRDASPVNSPAGESDGIGNPWDLVLAVEGCLLLTAGAARRHGIVSDTTMVAPFTVRPTAAGYGSAVSGESGRAELWLPIWEAWTGLTELEAITREARAQVGRRNARSGLDFARSCGEMAVARGISEFARFALMERTGQATLAVPAGRIEVRERPAVAAIRTIDQWFVRVQSHAHANSGRALREGVTRLERSLFDLAERGDPISACVVLERLGEVESLLATSTTAGSSDAPMPLGKVPATVWLKAANDGGMEFAIAASLASLHDRVTTTALPAMRDYLHGTSVDADGHRTYAGRPERAAPRRANAIERLALIHRRRHLDAERLQAEHGVAREGPDTDLAVRELAFARGIYCPLALARRFARGDTDLDDARIARLLAGLALLDFSPVQDAAIHTDTGGLPLPAFDLLVLAWAGTSDPASHRERDGSDPISAGRQRHTARSEINRDPPEKSSSNGLATHTSPPFVALQPRPGWVALLATGQAGPLQRVFDNTLLRLRMFRLQPLLTTEDLFACGLSGPRLAAALLLRVDPRERVEIARRLTTTSDNDPISEGAMP